MAREPVTIKDVAKKAGVAISTVSSVINGNEKHVGSATRDRILQVARDLNYRPNAIARSMVKRTTTSIGLVITDVQNPLFNEVDAGVEEVLAAEGYHLLLANAMNASSEAEAIETFRSKQVDGFIFMSRSRYYPTHNFASLKADNIPFVVINRDMQDSEINQVLLDDFGAGLISTRHLISLGHTRIATIAGPLRDQPVWRSAHERHRGWRQAMQEKGLPVREDWIIPCRYTYEAGYNAARQLIEQNPDKATRPSAIFAANDSMAVGAMKALQEMGLRLPQDMAIVGVGDLPHLAYLHPSLTTMSIPIFEAGRVATRLLINWIKNGKPDCAQNVTLSCTLKIRESCGSALLNPVSNRA
ncbi:MAG TPA: LacI family DNA-binding transcriptional regulator [Chloroflexia bacterium]|nr:LacI family DNA-binding transcriptional regulator [Chloroflexia bacterium]